MPPPRRPPPSPRRPAIRRRTVILFGIVAAAVGVAYWSAGSRSTPPPLDPARDTIVFLGDSITSGHGLPLEATFPHRLGLALGVPVRNAGVSGDQTAGGLARLEQDVVVHRPKLVVVELGPNDAFRRVPKAQTFANLRAIVRRLHEDGAGVVLVHVGLPGLASDHSVNDFRAIAREERAWLVEDFLGGVVLGYSTDGLHPSEEGHARLAARLEPVLREILAR